MSRVSKKTLRDAVTRVREVADKEGWVFTLDRDEGNFYYSPEHVKRDARLYQVTDEYAIYLDKKNKPCGVMVEYFGNNYVEHHPEIKKMSGAIFKSKDAIVVVDPGTKRNREARNLKIAFESFLVAETLKGGHCK
jgi:hypothetical protein